MNLHVSTIRVDAHPSFQSLVNDEILQEQGITIESGRIFNKNKNPVAEIQELELELLKFDHMSKPITSTDLV